MNNPGPLRTDVTSGTITAVFGILMIVFSSFGLMMVALQRIMIPVMRFPPDEEAQQILDMMQAINGVWFIYFPIMLVGGIVYAIAGFRVRRGSERARRVAQANAIVGYLWVIGYSISCYQIMDIAAPPLNALPDPARTIFKWLTLGFGTLMGAAFSTGLLYTLSRPRKAPAAAPTGPSHADPKKPG